MKLVRFSTNGQSPRLGCSRATGSATFKPVSPRSWRGTA